MGPLSQSPGVVRSPIRYTVKHFPSQKSGNPTSTPFLSSLPTSHPNSTFFLFTSGKCSGVSLLSLLTDAFIYCSASIWNFTLHPDSWSNSAPRAINMFKSQSHHSIACLYYQHLLYTGSSILNSTHLWRQRPMSVKTSSTPWSGAWQSLEQSLCVC